MLADTGTGTELLGLPCWSTLVQQIGGLINLPLSLPLALLLQVLLATEGVQLQFTDGAIQATAQAAEDANTLLDNIGARRLVRMIRGQA